MSVLGNTRSWIGLKNPALLALRYDISLNSGYIDDHGTAASSIIASQSGTSRSVWSIRGTKVSVSIIQDNPLILTDNISHSREAMSAL